MTDPAARAEVWLSSAESLTAHGRELLLQEAGDASSALRCFSPRAAALIGDKAYRELSEAGETLDRTLERLQALSIRAITPLSPDFPEKLRNIPDPPPLLFVRGNFADRPAVAIVGSRRDTRYGREQAARIARELAEAGVVIVSGLARGIDTAAHRGAVAAQGVSYAVMGCGLDQIYPSENAGLADELLRWGGALVSEFPPGSAPLPYHFPRRNRLISGLADGVLLVEATLRSGTQSTINHALNQGRTVFALPGNVDAPGSELPLRLLKDGAELCTQAADILDRLKIERRAAAPRPSDGEPDDPLLKALYRETKTFEELLAETGLSAPALTARLSLLELDGKIERLPGQSFALARA